MPSAYSDIMEMMQQKPFRTAELIGNGAGEEKYGTVWHSNTSSLGEIQTITSSRPARNGKAGVRKLCEQSGRKRIVKLLG
ncbi:hypothetical protein NDU88_008818 [Pleurodeles waltl]|uniref:Uncharacterized protein n=1 Tax=Pleurodeles waltl TaxID=8319 RepID=A0AAV7PSP4_PLEWA|nr:hypothetical protein NDU88_008818 [Pleurodeles waltl]